MRVAVDTGGTFTDVVTARGDVRKLPTTPDDPARAVQSGLVGLGPVEQLAHGTTVATNALLEGRGARVALVASEGFADLIEIARQTRPSLYDPWADRPEPLVPRALRVEAGAWGGHVAVPDGVDAVAVSLLDADLDPGPERDVAQHLRARGIDVTCSHEVSPEFREYERTVTTVANATLRPRCRAYLRAVAELVPDALVMTSAAGLVPAGSIGAELPVLLVLSGPAGGVRAAAAVAAACGFADAVSFDMGGTSTDVGLIRDGRPEVASGRTVAGLALRVRALDVHTIGAGGGSIARLDAGGALVVGPRSAGARPGPAAYGFGGTEPTVTDADLVLGRIPRDAVLGGLGRLDARAAEAALARAGVTAEGVVRVVDAAMERAVRVMTVERGIDPRELALVAFGGAGPLHACAVAEALGMAAVIVPPRAGVLSAVGLVTAPRQRDLVRSWPTPGAHGGVDDALDRLGREAAALVGADARVETFVDCRFAGQAHELTVPRVGDLRDEHDRRNGFVPEGLATEVIALRARAVGPAPRGVTELPEVRRDPARGPAVLAEADSTVWLPRGWEATVGPLGSWVLRRHGAR